MRAGFQKSDVESPAKRRAFTLIELLVVVTLLAIIAAVGFPTYRRVVDASRREVAIVQARSVNAARVSFALSVPDANAQWQAAADDTARVNLLIAQQLLSGSASDYVNPPGGYTVRMDGLVRSPCTIMYGGSAIPY